MTLRHGAILALAIIVSACAAYSRRIEQSYIAQAAQACDAYGYPANNPRHQECVTNTVAEIKAQQQREAQADIVGGVAVGSAASLNRSASAPIRPAGSYYGDAQQITLCPNGSYVRGQCVLAPDGSYVSGQPTLAPNGSYVAGTPRLAPNGAYVGDGGPIILCPDGSYVAGQTCILTPGGHYVGGN